MINIDYYIEKTKETGIYKFYRQVLLDVEDDTLKYKKIGSVSQDEINTLNLNTVMNPQQTYRSSFSIKISFLLVFIYPMSDSKQESLITAYFCFVG